MNRTLFYFDKSSIAKACERVKEFCTIVSNDSRFNIVSPILNVYQIPGDIDNKKSALFVKSNQSSCVDYVNRMIMGYGWKAEGIEGFEEAKSGASEEIKVGSFKEPEPKPFVYFSCKTGAEADLIAATARHKFEKEIEDGKLSIEKTVSQRDKLKTYIRARSLEQKYRDDFNTFINNFSWESYGIQKPEMHASEACTEHDVEIRIVGLAQVKASEEELESFGLKRVESNPESIFELDRKVREELCRRQEESLKRATIQPSKFEAVKPPFDFASGAAEVALRHALKAEGCGLFSNNMYEVLENAKQIYDFLRGVSSHFVDGKSLGGK